MIVEDWVDADPRRQPRSSHLWLGEQWTGHDPQLTYGVGWAPETGELYAVDELGGVEVLAALSAEELEVALKGWELARALPGSLHWLRIAASSSLRRGLGVAHLEPEVQRTLDLGEVVKRAPALPYEEWMAVDPDREVAHRDLGLDWRGEPTDVPRSLRWVPTTRELYLVEQLDGGREGMVEVLTTIPDEERLATCLDGWQTRVGEAGSLYWLRTTLAERMEVDGRHGHDVRANLALVPDLSESPWSLPVEPVAGLIRDLQAETGDPVELIAKSMDVEPEWAEQVLAGDIPAVDLPHVRRVCEALSCSPDDVWGRVNVERILPVYGPAEWPEHIEPLGRPHVLGLPMPEPEPAMEMDLDL